MIHLNATTFGKTKREYIEAVVEDCRLIFNRTFMVDLLRDDNFKVDFCTYKDQASVYQTFCERYFPLYLAEEYSRTEYFAAQALTNREEDIYGILVCLDTSDEGNIWYQIILHEMSHIFCILNEIGEENFQEKFSKQNIADANEYALLSIGYAIWREFIADYIASQINPFAKALSLTDLRSIVRQLDQEICLDNPERAQNCSLLLCHILLQPQIMSAAGADTAIQILRKQRVLPGGRKRRYYEELIEEIFSQLGRDPVWKIDIDFIRELGKTYLLLLYF